MATSEKRHVPTVSVRCPNCRKAYYDSNYQVCRECGAQL